MHWKWRVRHSRGYRELGLFAEAAEELATVPMECRDEFDVLVERAALSQETGAWRELEIVCGELTRQQPEDAGWWIMRAYGVRRAESLSAAEKVLLEAEALHAADATIQFNLGCYACQRGDLSLAHARVKRAIELDKIFLELAQNDPDLEPLRTASLL